MIDNASLDYYIGGHDISFVGWLDINGLVGLGGIENAVYDDYLFNPTLDGDSRPFVLLEQTIFNAQTFNLLLRRISPQHTQTVTKAMTHDAAINHEVFCSRLSLNAGTMLLRTGQFAAAPVKDKTLQDYPLATIA